MLLSRRQFKLLFVVTCLLFESDRWRPVTGFTSSSSSSSSSRRGPKGVLPQQQERIGRYNNNNNCVCSPPEPLFASRQEVDEYTDKEYKFWKVLWYRATNTMDAAGFDPIQIKDKQGNVVEELTHRQSRGTKQVFFMIILFYGLKWYRARFINKIPVWDRQPTWNMVITRPEQEKNLKAVRCKNCGSTIFVAKNRDSMFRGNRGLAGFGCFTCGAKGKENFEDVRKQILEELPEDDYFDYERPLDFVSRNERKRLLKESGGDETKANEILWEQQEESGKTKEEEALVEKDDWVGGSGTGKTKAFFKRKKIPKGVDTAAAAKKKKTGKRKKKRKKKKRKKIIAEDEDATAATTTTTTLPPPPQVATTTMAAAPPASSLEPESTLETPPPPSSPPSLDQPATVADPVVVEEEESDVMPLSSTTPPTILPDDENELDILGMDG